MITGAQIRRARELLNWQASTLAQKAHLPVSTVHRAEGAQDEGRITTAHQSAIRLALEAAGIEFTGGDATAVTLTRSGSPRTRPDKLNSEHDG